MVDQPDPVGPHGGTEQSVFLRLDTDQVEHIPTNKVHPGVKMFHIQPVADGPAGPDRTRRPVGNDVLHAVQDEVRPSAGGPVGRFPDPDYERSTQTRSESESDTGALDSVIRTGSEVHTGRVNTSMANGPKDSSVVSSSSDPVVYGLGKQMNRTKRESESAAGIPDPVIQTGSKVQTDGVNIGMVNGQTDSSVTSPSSDSGVHSLGEQWET